MSIITTDDLYSSSTYLPYSNLPSSSTELPYLQSTTINSILNATDDPGKGSMIVNETITDLNVTTTEYIPILAAATAFATLIVIGLISTFIFIVVLIRGRKRFQEFPFFAIIHHLTATNAIHILMQCTTVLPVMLLDMSSDPISLYWYKIGSYCIMVTEQAALYFTLLMTINRFAVFVYPPILRIFTTRGIHIISIFIWIYINFIVFWNYNYGTIRTFSKKKLTTQEVLLGTNFLSQFFTLCSFCLPIIMLAMYFLIFIFIIKKRKVVENRKKNDRDTSLVVQAMVITIALEVVNITDMLTPFLTKYSTSVQWIWTIFCYCVTIFNQTVNPLLFLLFNKMVRGVARHAFDKNLTTFFSETSSSPKVQGSRKTNKPRSSSSSSFCCFPRRPKESDASSKVVTF